MNDQQISGRELFHPPSELCISRNDRVIPAIESLCGCTGAEAPDQKYKKT